MKSPINLFTLVRQLTTASTVSCDAPSDLLDDSDVRFENIPEPRGRKPKAERLDSVYWDLHKNRLRPLYKGAGSGSKRIANWSAFLADAWAKEPDEVHRDVVAERNKRHQAAIESWSMSGLRPLDLETQRRYVVFQYTILPT